MAKFLEVLQTKDNGIYNKFVKYLEEDYDWVAYTLQNTQIQSQEITDYLSSRSSSSRLSTAETVTMSEKMRNEQSVERDRDRMIRSARNSHHQDDAEVERLRHEFRDR